MAATTASGHGAGTDFFHHVSPLRDEAGGLNELHEGGWYARPAVKAGFKAGRGVAAFALVFVAGGDAACFAREFSPVLEHGGGIDAATARMGREPGSANGGAVSGKVRDKF